MIAGEDPRVLGIQASAAYNGRSTCKATRFPNVARPRNRE